MQQMIGELKFADRGETKKALKELNRQIKNLFDLIQSRGSATERADEAMFGRKHVCGYACASCEKDLVNLHGRKVDYMPWGKLPFRDPTERIARVGQGFSKMLSIINPEQMSRYDQVRQVSTHDALRRTQQYFNQSVD